VREREGLGAVDWQFRVLNRSHLVSARVHELRVMTSKRRSA